MSVTLFVKEVEYRYKKKCKYKFKYIRYIDTFNIEVLPNHSAIKHILYVKNKSRLPCNT